MDNVELCLVLIFWCDLLFIANLLCLDSAITRATKTIVDAIEKRASGE